MPAGSDMGGKGLAKKISVVSITSVEEEEEYTSPANGGRKVRFGTGKNSRVQLVPQPSDSSRDPLNWSRWKKELTFGSLLLTTAVVGILKTMLVTVNSVIATEFNVSYMGATALTGAPMMIAGIAGLGSGILAQMIGKRIIYLVGGLLMLLGLVGNMSVMESYNQFMAARVFQAVGWGAVEALVLGSIRDLFFLHERNARVNAYNAVTLFFTWGSPILGGRLSQSSDEFRRNILAITIIQAVAFLFLIFAAPETTFHRSTVPQSPVRTGTFTSTVTTANTLHSSSTFKSYFSSLRLTTPHSTTAFNTTTTLLPLRGLVCPSTLLTLLLTAPLLATTYGLTQTLSLIFAAMPTFLFPSHIGYLFILPLLLTLVLYSLASLLTTVLSRPPNHLSTTRHLTIAFPAILLGVVGLLSLGIYTSSQLTPKITQAGTVFSLNSSSQSISLRVISGLLGLLISAASILSYSGSQHLSTTVSLSPTQSASMENAPRILQDFLAGIFILAFPGWVQGSLDSGVGSAVGIDGVVAGLKVTVVVIGVVQFCVGSTVGAVIWTKGREVVKVDAKILGVRRREGRSTQMRRWPGSVGSV